jgi:hypothetical protein
MESENGMEVDEDVLVTAAGTFVQLLATIKANRQKKRRFWVHPVLQRRKLLGEYHRLVNELRVERPMHFYL